MHVCVCVHKCVCAFPWKTIWTYATKEMLGSIFRKVGLLAYSNPGIFTSHPSMKTATKTFLARFSPGDVLHTMFVDLGGIVGGGKASHGFLHNDYM